MQQTTKTYAKITLQAELPFRLLLTIVGFFKTNSVDPDQTAYVGNFKKGYYHIHIRVTATFVLLLGPFEQISFPH